MNVGSKVKYRGNKHLNGTIKSSGTSGNGLIFYVEWAQNEYGYTHGFYKLEDICFITDGDEEKKQQSEWNTTCFLCGAPAFDLVFSVICSKSGCKNYRKD